MKFGLSRRNSFLVLAATISVVLVTVIGVARWGANDTARAQAPFSNATLKGTYAFVTAGGSPTEAAYGLIVADGNGNITSGKLTLNVPRSVLVPGAAGRTTVPATVTSGSYTVNADGTGSASATASIPGQILTRNFDTTIVELDGAVAKEVALGQIEPTLGGGLGYYALKRVR